MLNLKTIFKQKSKILLTIICIFGLAFSYSCSCRNNDKFGSTGTFTATPDAMNNLLDLYIQSDNNTNSVVVIKFKSEQNISAAKIIEVKHKSGTDVGLTKDELGYSLQNSELQLGDNDTTRKKIAGALTQEGETSVITLTMELTSDSANLNNTTTTVDVDVNLIKAIKLTTQNIETLFKTVGVMTPGTGLGYDFYFSDGTLSGNKFEGVKNKGIKSSDSITPILFATELMSDSEIFGFNKTEVKELGYISSVNVEFLNGTTATFNVTFSFAPKYEASTTKYTIVADAKSSEGSQAGAWKEQVN